MITRIRSHYPLPDSIGTWDDLLLKVTLNEQKKIGPNFISEDEVEHCDHLCGPVFGLDGGTDAAKGIQRHSRALQSTRADRSPTRLSARIRREQPRRG